MDQRTNRSGLGLVSVLTLIFLVLKLTGLIRWAWLWVLSPLWISAALAGAVFGTLLLAGRLKKGKW